MKMTSADLLEVKVGEAISGTAPTYEIDAAEVTATNLVPISSSSTLEKGNFTASYATAAAAPTSGNQKGVSRIVICNLDSIAHTFFLRRNRSSTFTFQLPGTTLQTLEFATYEIGHGWQFYDAYGNRK